MKRIGVVISATLLLTLGACSSDPNKALVNSLDQCLGGEVPNRQFFVPMKAGVELGDVFDADSGNVTHAGCWSGETRVGTLDMNSSCELISNKNIELLAQAENLLGTKIEIDKDSIVKVQLNGLTSKTLLNPKPSGKEDCSTKFDSVPEGPFYTTLLKFDNISLTAETKDDLNASLTSDPDDDELQGIVEINSGAKSNAYKTITHSVNDAYVAYYISHSQKINSSVSKRCSVFNICKINSYDMELDFKGINQNTNSIFLTIKHDSFGVIEFDKENPLYVGVEKYLNASNLAQYSIKVNSFDKSNADVLLEINLSERKIISGLNSSY